MGFPFFFKVMFLYPVIKIEVQFRLDFKTSETVPKHLGPSSFSTETYSD